MQPNSPFLTPRQAERWRSEASRALPLASPAKTHVNSKAVQLALRLLVLVFIVLVVAVAALWFFLFGEDSQRVRPELTPAQRARAFRLPQP